MPSAASKVRFAGSWGQDSIPLFNSNDSIAPVLDSEGGERDSTAVILIATPG